ncbi:MAG TPA: Rieske 2Fe-2S domain-containing protein [Candidatus Limnocylindrales bacterium]|jgi:cytochrome b6-f complex iron-sulfur subunit|nr:Rieske 2Fe-2S domain-containing protein [Candidatus Limnocylindrales bacterium]
MGNWQLTRGDHPQALTRDALRSLRGGQPAGLSRRTLLRRSIGGGMALWLTEVLGGTVGFLWPNLAGGFGAALQLGTLDEVAASPAITGAGIKDGAPSYFQAARAYIQLIDPSRGFVAGVSTDGDGLGLNVRALYQRCPHLGCKPNFCITNYWFECPCHGSRYDRLGQKVLGLGPAPRSLDRFATSVDSGGVLTVDTSKITLGPLPVALGQPGVIPPKSPVGCI